MDAIEVTEAELVVPLLVDGISLEEQADIDPYGSNDGLTAGELTLRMPTPASRTPIEPPDITDPAFSQLVAPAPVNPSSTQFVAKITNTT